MPSERSEQTLQRDKVEHDRTRETGLAVVTRRNLRALAANPQRPAPLEWVHTVGLTSSD